MEDIIKKHTELRKLLDKKISEKTRLEGQLESQMKQIKDEFDCNSLDELSAMIDRDEDKLEKLKKIIPPMLEEVERKLKNV